MGKKILVIEDWEKFLHECIWDSALRDQGFESHPTLVDLHQIGPTVAEKLSKYEVDVTEFETRVYKTGDHSINRITIPENIRAKLIESERYKVFVVKPKKPEVKDG